MIKSSKFVEQLLQKFRFSLVKSYLIGDVLDFGGNKGELKKLVKGKYLIVNYDHSVMEGTYFDTIVCLAVIEHVNIHDVYEIFIKFKRILKKDGRILITTPTKKAKPILEFLAFIRILDTENILEHKHYWTKVEIYKLAKKSGFNIKKYKQFQFGFNQFSILEHQ